MSEQVKEKKQKKVKIPGNPIHERKLEILCYLDERKGLALEEELLNFFAEVKMNREKGTPVLNKDGTVKISKPTSPIKTMTDSGWIESFMDCGAFNENGTKQIEKSQRWLQIKDLGREVLNGVNVEEARIAARLSNIDTQVVETYRFISLSAFRMSRTGMLLDRKITELFCKSNPSAVVVEVRAVRRKAGGLKYGL